MGVRLNGSELGRIEWADQLPGEGSFAVPAGVLREGQSILTFEPLGFEGDVSLIDRVVVRYGHTYQADRGVLSCTVPGGAGVVLSGFGSNDVRVVGVSDAHHPRDLQGPFAGNSIGVVVPGEGTRRVIAFSGTSLQRPAWVRAERPSALWASPGADLVIVSAGEFLPVLEPLIELRQSQGLRVLGGTTGPHWRSSQQWQMSSLRLSRSPC